MKALPMIAPELYSQAFENVWWEEIPKPIRYGFLRFNECRFLK